MQNIINLCLEVLSSHEEGLWYLFGLLSGVAIMWLPGYIRRKLLRKKVAEAYMKFRNACEPETLNPDSPGNLAFMRSDARDSAVDLTCSLVKAGYIPPDQCDTTEESLNDWFVFLRSVKMNGG